MKTESRAVPAFAVTLLPTGRQFVAVAETTVLRAAMDAGISMLSSCRNGTCRTCIARLVSGEVRYAIEWPGLSADEKREGWLLPCVAHATTDLVIAPT